MRITILVLLSILSCAVHATTVGELHRTTTTPTAAIRDATRSDQLAITVWYPSVAGAKEAALDIGPPGKPLFLPGRAASDAPFAAGRHPVVLLSHGFGGTARMMAWFGTALARQGYVVIAVDHPGNNGRGEITLAGAALWWERAEDLKAAWRAIQSDATVSPHLDARRLGVAGFSAGGFTALVAGGARVDVQRFIAFCDAHPDDGVCRPQMEAPQLAHVDRHKLADDPVLGPQWANAGKDHSVPGVKAVFAMAPAIVQAIDPMSYAKLRMPVAIVVGRDDDVAPPATNADVAVAAIRGASIDRLPGVGHYDFLADCTDAARAVVPQCAKAKVQSLAHERAIADALRVFASMSVDQRSQVAEGMPEGSQ